MLSGTSMRAPGLLSPPYKDNIFKILIDAQFLLPLEESQRIFTTELVDAWAFFLAARRGGG